jgi:methionine-rich copper-binding protein CopC
MIRPAIALCAGAALLLAAGAALAHPMFVAAAPRRGAVIPVAPKEIRISFSEAILAKGSSFTLVDAEGRPMRTGTPEIAPQDSRTVLLPIRQALAPGGYTVRWRVLAAGHSAVPGLYRFQIRR